MEIRSLPVPFDEKFSDGWMDRQTSTDLLEGQILGLRGQIQGMRGKISGLRRPISGLKGPGG